MITVVVLAFNEEKLLATTVHTMMDAGREAGNIPLDIIIINDGSTDGTAAIIKDLEAKFPCVRSIHHSINQGPGVGVKEAIARARYEKFIVTPGDNDLSKDLLVSLFANADKADLVMAYYLNMKDRGFFRSTLSALYTGLYRITFNTPIYYINSPCLYPSDQLRQIHIRSDRFGYSAEMTIKLLRKGLSFYQVGGYRHVHAKASRAISWRNLQEVMDTFIHLVLEIKVSKRAAYNHAPVELKNA